MNKNVYSIENYRTSKRKEGLVVLKGMTWFATAIMVIGGILSLVNLDDFSTTNLGLMLGFSMLIASVQMFGMILVMLFFIPKRSANNNSTKDLKVKNIS